MELIFRLKSLDLPDEVQKWDAVTFNIEKDSTEIKIDYCKINVKTYDLLQMLDHITRFWAKGQADFYHNLRKELDNNFKK